MWPSLTTRNSRQKESPKPSEINFKVFMYTLIDWLLTLISWFLIIFLPIYYEDGYYCLIGIASYLLYPIPMEIIYNCLASWMYTESDIARSHQVELQAVFFTNQAIHKFQGLPIVYDPNYNITACGIEKLHPFDSCKYERVFQKLTQEFVVNEKMVFRPSKCPRGLMLRLGVGKCYLLSLCYSFNVFRIVEVPICILPAAFLRQRLLDPMLYSTQGTIDAVCLAIEKGWSINIGGGYHHASLNQGGGQIVHHPHQIQLLCLPRHHFGHHVPQVVPP